jgi:hypothetical protein
LGSAAETRESPGFFIYASGQNLTIVGRPVRAPGCQSGFDAVSVLQDVTSVTFGLLIVLTRF